MSIYWCIWKMLPQLIRYSMYDISLLLPSMSVYVDWGTAQSCELSIVSQVNVFYANNSHNNISHCLASSGCCLGPRTELAPAAGPAEVFGVSNISTLSSTIVRCYSLPCPLSEACFFFFFKSMVINFQFHRTANMCTQAEEIKFSWIHILKD